MTETLNAGARAVGRCDTLGRPPYSASETGLDRGFLTPAHRAAIEAVTGWMGEAGLSTRVDEIGNLIGRSAAPRDAPTLLIGSHLDSVQGGGRYDGTLGVMIGIECADALRRRAAALPFAVEVIAFGDEEGSRFPAAMMGSRALAGGWRPTWLGMTDAAGVTLAEAMSAFGLDPTKARRAARRPEHVLAYVEAHIEQGPVLEAEDRPIGVVSAIAGQVRMLARFSGSAGHAGTTPMPLRRDALAAAAEAIVEVERICADGPPGLVGTVGHVSASPSAFNVIAGAAEIGVDIRAPSGRERDAAAGAVVAAIEALAARRGIEVRIQKLQSLAAAPCDPHLTDLMEAAVAGVGVEPMSLVSGAGHDAMAMGKLAPTAMLFVRCAGGISHHPAEAVDPADVTIACRAMAGFVERLAEDFA
jgi:allantoate deiminase